MFYQQAAAMDWKQRDSFVLAQFRGGNMPGFLKRFIPVNTSIMAGSKKIKATFYVMPDYFSVGNDQDWARVNITPMLAQRIADSMDCFLPTRKIVDAIYQAASIKLTPVPMYAFRDSTPTMWHHHLIIEGQRQQRTGLIAGIKKDLVISDKIITDGRPARVAIYGWHQLNGRPIQPLYAGHINWYVDYSQGTRLIYRKIKVGNKWIDYKEVLKDPVLNKLLCDEDGGCRFTDYPY